MAPFWQPPTTQATRPRPRLLAENGRTGLERGPQPHIIASPPGTGAPIDRINYTPDTGEVHPPGVLAPIDKLNYSLVPHDDLNYSGQLGQSASPSAGGGMAQGGGDAGSAMSSGMQPQQPMQSNVWANTGDPSRMGMGADSIVKSPGTPAGTDGLTGRYGENATQRSNVFSPGQPPLSPNPYGTGPGPRVQASGPITRPFDERASNTGNLGDWGQSMGTGADDDGDGYDDDTGEPVDDSPEAAIYGRGGGGSQGGTNPGGSSSVVTPDTGGMGGTDQAPTSAPPGYHFVLDPPNDAQGQPPRGGDKRPLRQTLWQVPEDPSKPKIPLGFYDAQFKAGSSERPYTRFTEKEQRSMSPDYAKELDAAAKGTSASGNHVTEVVGSDGKMHRVMVDKDGKQISDIGVSQVDKTTAPGHPGDTKVLGPNSLHPRVLVLSDDGINYTEDEAQSAQLAKDNADKAQAAADKAEADREQRLASSQSKPFTVYNDSSGQSWKVNTQTGEQEALGKADPKNGTWDLNGRLVHYNQDTGTFDEVYKPPPGYDLHYDTYGRAVAVNKDDPSKSSVVYTPEDYEDRKALDRQKTLADIEKTKSGLLTDKAAQVKSRVDLLNTLQGLENPAPKFIGTSDIYFGPGTQADVQRYNPETKSSTFEHYSGGPRSAEQTSSIARIHSMLDELDKAFASGDAAKASQIQEQIKADQGGKQTQQPRQEDQPGIIDVGQQIRDARGGQDIRPGYPSYDPEHLNPNPPTNRTTAAGDIAQYDENGNLTGIKYLNTAPPNYGEPGYPGSEGYGGVGSTLQGGLGGSEQPAEETPWGQEEPPPEDQAAQESEQYWANRRRGYMGTGTDIPQGGQGLPEKHKPAGNPGYSTEPSPMPAPMAPPPGSTPGMAPPGPGGAPGGPQQDPSAMASHPDFNPLNPPDLAALGPPGGGGGSAGATPVGTPGGPPGALPGLDDSLFRFAMQRRQGGVGGGVPTGSGADSGSAGAQMQTSPGTPPLGPGQSMGALRREQKQQYRKMYAQMSEPDPYRPQQQQQRPMGGGQDEPGGGYAGWTPPVPQDDVAGIGHRFGQPMNVGEPYHSGVDLQAVEGTPTIAPVDGVVQRVEYNPQGLGITVVLQGKDGTTHKLGHLKETEAYPGLVVSQGQDLQSKVGSTGNTTGSHLHWAVKTPDGQPTDPTASLGAMASLPPVPGTQMMGPPGGTSAPGGPGMGGRGAPSPLATPAPGLAVPQGAPPPPPAQPPPGGQPQPPMGGGQDMGAGQMVSREDILNSKLWDPVYTTNPRASRIMLGKRGGILGEDPRGMPPWEEMDLNYQPGALGTGADTAPSLGSADLPDEPEDHPLSPFSFSNKNPYGFNDRNLMLLWNQQHNRWLNAQRQKQGEPNLVSEAGGPPDPDWASKSQAEREAARIKRRQETLSDFAPTGRATEVPQTGEPPDEEETWWQDEEDRPRVYQPGQGMAGRGSSPGQVQGQEVGGRYQRSEELRGQTAAEQRGRKSAAWDIPGSPNSPYREGVTNPFSPETLEGKTWQRQNDWFRRKKQPQIVLNERLDKLAEQGWPQDAIDEMKQLGRAPTKAEAEAIRAKYKTPATSPDQPDTAAEIASQKSGVTEQMGPGAQRLREAAQARGPLDPNAPDYVPPDEYTTGGVLDQMGPGGKRLSGLTEEQPKPGWEPPVDTLGLEPNGGLNPGEPKVDPEEYEFPEVLTQRKRAAEAAAKGMTPEEYDDWLHNEQSGYNDAVRQGDTGAAIKHLPGSTQPNPSVERPIDLGGGHKPPVGPDIRDILSKPAINVLPGPITGGHIPVPLPEGPKGHVPGPEIKLPSITDIPHPDIQLPGWLPGQGGQTQQPTEGGTPESYSDMLERLRQMGQGAGADNGDDAQIAQALGISPDQITDEIRQWWEARPLPEGVQPGDSGQTSSDGMGAGLQLGPIHLSTTMRQPMRMPSSRMEMGRRAGWTPRGGGMKRRQSMGTSAMMNLGSSLL